MRKKLLQLLVDHSYERADEPIFKLSSGRMSDTYINCKATMLRAEAAPLIGEVCAGLIPSGAQAIGGLTMGADPIADSISKYFTYVKHQNLDQFVVRKTPKAHGKQLYIEGVIGKRVVVVDDVVTTGGSTIQAIDRCREANMEVLAVIILVDREENEGLSKIKEAVGKAVPVHAIFTKTELAAAAPSGTVRDDAHPTAARPQAAAI